ncbi:hypothetical protein Syun_027336 [Stephania yunnanensis]|uniref:Peroxisomal membrane protein n=1 Tax=Stephania yunnanensis TaxID=152371 RepID=A0AAP0EFG2_9MAGN
MASLNTITSQKFFSPKPTKEPQFPSKLQRLNLPLNGLSGSSLKPQTSTNLSFHNDTTTTAAAEEEEAASLIDMEMEEEGMMVGSQVVSGFVNEGRFSLEGAGELNGFSSSAAATGSGGGGGVGEVDEERLVDRAINAAIVLAAGTFAITKLLTIDHDYWHGWTFFEILRYAPQHNWDAYEDALKSNPVFAKMVISGVVYTIGDWIAQCYEGKPLLEFERARAFRSGLVGFLLHGSLSHYYYQFCEALFPSKDWWVVPAKVVFDQTAWSAVWNSIYYGVLGLLRRESPDIILAELKATFWPMITYEEAGWKLWPFAHLITYGVIPLEQRLLWVDCVELIWVTILSTYSNEKSESRHSGATVETNNDSQTVINKDMTELLLCWYFEL